MVSLSNKKNPYKLIYAGLAILFIVSGISLAFIGYKKIDSIQRNHLIDRASTIAKIISLDNLKTLNGSESDLFNPSYIQLKEELTNAVKVNKDVRFIYLIGKNVDGSLFFYVDSEDPQSEDYSAPGQIYGEASPEMYGIFKDGVSIAEGPTKDRWGIWISGSAPVFDENGNVIAILGMDSPAKEFIETNLAYAIVPLLVSAMLLLLLYFFRFIEQKERKYLEVKEEFLSIASHEIRTPLMGMKWALEYILNKNSINDEEAKGALEQVYKNTTALIKETNDLLSLKALEEAHKTKVNNEQINLKNFFDEILQILFLSAREHNVRLIINNKLSENEYILSDRKSLRQIFINLLINAIKYTKPNTDVSISYEWKEDKLTFEVEDNGEGMSEEETKNIFNGYYRTRKAQESKETGTGLGLYITKKIVESLKGNISVKSEIGKGSKFIVTLPVKNT